MVGGHIQRYDLATEFYKKKSANLVKVLGGTQAEKEAGRSASIVSRYGRLGYRGSILGRGKGFLL
jgi:uncharacterized protein (DUF924 family)